MKPATIVTVLISVLVLLLVSFAFLAARTKVEAALRPVRVINFATPNSSAPDAEESALQIETKINTLENQGYRIVGISTNGSVNGLLFLELNQ